MTSVLQPTSSNVREAWHRFADYVVIIPAFGIVSEVLATSARRSIFGYKSMVFAMAGIGIVGFIVWGHHMLTSGMDPFWRAAFMCRLLLRLT